MAWGIENNYQQSKMLLLILAKRDYGVEFKDLVPAAPREQLKIFGGPLTIDEFRLKRQTLPPKKEKSIYSIIEAKKVRRLLAIGQKFSF